MPRSSLPTRVPGAHLTQLVEPPDDGWFGTPVEWPTQDPDVGHLRRSGVPDGPGTELLERVLAGVKRL